MAFEKSEVVDVAVGEYKTIATSIELPADVSGLSVKAFIWDTNYTPLRPASVYN